jgi:cytochrome c553
MNARMKTGWVGLLLLTAVACRPAPELPADVQAAQFTLRETVDYNLHIKPILSDRCFACHGPDQAKQKAGLRLDIADQAYATLKSGKRAIVPGDLRDSELFRRIVSTDPEVIMPTPESHLSLSADEKATLLRWIEQGAAYKKHWSLITPAKPNLPSQYDSSWVKNDIDRFVGAKLREKGFTPNPEADKTTLLRRVSLDLTGLPPTPAEVDAFLADKSPNAYEKVVNRLLGSVHYGEHMAASWLDLARYADTHGYQLDVMRTAWPYRDWVIQAFNRNLAYDRFITWQLAGDLLTGPNPPNRNQLIATAFNRMHPQNQEGGIVEEEYLTEYAADRTATFGKAMLGLTVECARCHDHKYDPISQKDYYRLLAYFNTINEAGQVPFNGESSPTLILTDRKAEQQLAYIQSKIRAIPKVAGSGTKGPIARYTFDDTTRYRFANAVDPARPAKVTGNTDLPPEVGPGRFGRGAVSEWGRRYRSGPETGVLRPI